MMKNKKRFFGPKGPLSIVRILPLVVLPVLGPLEKGSLPGESISTYFAVSASDVFLDFLRNGLRILSFTFADGTVSLPIGVVRYIILVMPLGLQKKSLLWTRFAERNSYSSCRSLTLCVRMHRSRMQTARLRASWAEATMFWITISGLPGITIPSLFNSSTTFKTALWAWRSDFAPVQTIFPELNIRVAVLGFFNR